MARVPLLTAVGNQLRQKGRNTFVRILGGKILIKYGKQKARQQLSTSSPPVKDGVLLQGLNGIYRADHLLSHEVVCYPVCILGIL